MIAFTVPLDPVPKGRPRFWCGRAVTDEKTREFERAFRAAARPYLPSKPLKGPLNVFILCQIRKPPSVKREHPCVRPDLDNYAKAILDSLKGFWGDDGQVVRLHCEKRYGDAPLITVSIDRPVGWGWAA
jgi:Holliday junction resolvase RusA-like endonuclease